MKYFTDGVDVIRGESAPKGFADLGAFPDLDSVDVILLEVVDGIPRISEAKQTARLFKGLENTAQQLLDDVARLKGYDSALSCTSYGGEPGDLGAEANKMKRWRSDIWAWCFAQQAAYQTGSPIPSPEQFTILLTEACPPPWQ